MKKVLVTGASGLVGSRFIELYSNRYKFITPEYPDFDITNPDKIKKALTQLPDVVVNFAAFTDVSGAENQRGDRNGDCWKINVWGVKNLLSAIDHQKTHFIHISTDMVMSGAKDDPGPYSEDQAAETDLDKLTWYGFTKAEAEREIERRLAEKATIIRIIYPVRAKFAGKLDYLHGPLAKYDRGELKSMFADQQVSITFIDEFCEALARIIDGNKHGVFHVSSKDTASPYELVSFLVEKARGKKNSLEKGSLDELIRDGKVASYRYPKYGGLNVEETERKLGMKFSKWKQMIDKLIDQGLA